MSGNFELGLKLETREPEQQAPLVVGPGPARGPWTNLGRLPLRVFSIGKYAFQKKGASRPSLPVAKLCYSLRVLFKLAASRRLSPSSSRADGVGYWQLTALCDRDQVAKFDETAVRIMFQVT